MGVMTMKMISKTSKTSHSGTTLGSAFAMLSSLNLLGINFIANRRVCQLNLLSLLIIQALIFSKVQGKSNSQFAFFLLMIILKIKEEG